MGIHEEIKGIASQFAKLEITEALIRSRNRRAADRKLVLELEKNYFEVVEAMGLIPENSSHSEVIKHIRQLAGKKPDSELESYLTNRDAVRRLANQPVPGDQIGCNQCWHNHELLLRDDAHPKGGYTYIVCKNMEGNLVPDNDSGKGYRIDWVSKQGAKAPGSGKQSAKKNAKKKTKKSAKKAAKKQAKKRPEKKSGRIPRANH